MTLKTNELDILYDWIRIAIVQKESIKPEEFDLIRRILLESNNNNIENELHHLEKFIKK